MDQAGPEEEAGEPGGAGTVIGSAGADLIGAGRVGRYSEPVCPHPVTLNTHAPRISVRTKICFVINMVKL
jgi:hypothetical protein